MLFIGEVLFPQTPKLFSKRHISFCSLFIFSQVNNFKPHSHQMLCLCEWVGWFFDSFCMVSLQKKRFHHKANHVDEMEGPMEWSKVSVVWLLKQITSVVVEQSCNHALNNQVENSQITLNYNSLNSKSNILPLITPPKKLEQIELYQLWVTRRNLCICHWSFYPLHQNILEVPLKHPQRIHLEK